MDEPPPPTITDPDRDITLEEAETFRDLITAQSEARVCPLCGNRALWVRGLRRVGFFQISHGSKKSVSPPLQMEWGCRQCGYIVSFDIRHFEPTALPTTEPPPLSISPKIRTPQDQVLTKGGTGEVLATFIVSMGAWLLLTWSVALQDLILGVGVSAITAIFTYRLAGLSLATWWLSPRRWAAFLQLAIIVLWQLIMQNLSLVYRTFHPKLLINPGIVAVPIRLRSDFALTVLNNVMCLTPDTVVLDVDTEAGLMYVHWIDVQTQDPRQARELLVADMEDLIERWLL